VLWIADERRDTAISTRMTLSGGKPGRNFAAQQAADFIPTNPI